MSRRGLFRSWQPEVARVLRFPNPHFASAVALTTACLLMSGCASTRLDNARAAFAGRNPTAALASFPAMPGPRSNDSLLFLLERGTIRQTVSNYTDSVADFLEASETMDRLDVASVSQSSGSMVLNDMAKSFRGYPFEQVLAHAMAANNYIALGQNDDAAVEARAITRKLSGNLDGFPDIAFARYMAAACLELTGDRDGAGIEYRRASSLLGRVEIDPDTGRFSLAPATNSLQGTSSVSSTEPTPYAAPDAPSAWKRDLVCFIGIGVLGQARNSMSDWRNYHRWGVQPYADIYINGVLAGRSVPLNDTKQLHEASQSRVAAAKAAKTIVRTGIKFAVANAVSERNDALGALLWILLIGLENEDTRRWETLPRWLHVARVPCPETISEVKVVLRATDGTAVEEHVLPPPQARSSQMAVTFTRAL